MKKKLLFLVIYLLIISCSGLKNSHKNLARGQYDTAIDNSLAYLQKNRFGKKAPEFHQVLFEAYSKANEKDFRNLAYLQRDQNPESLERIYNTYLQLDRRQNKLRPILPIDGYNFETKNYASDILNSRNQLSEYLYNKASNKLNTSNKQFVREAHDDFKYIQKINPNYKNVPNLIQQSHAKGIDYVLVKLKNNTEQIIPRRLEQDLLNIDQYQLNNYWTIHHGELESNITYAYELQLLFENIILSPERVQEVFVTKDRKVVDGYKYVLDGKGNVKKDAKGNDIKVENIIKVQSTVHQYTQLKTCDIIAKVNVIDNYSHQIVNAFPLQSNYVFEHVYATHTGDRRALSRNYIDLLRVRQVQFPSNEQMVFDAGNDIKRQLKQMLTQPNYR